MAQKRSASDMTSSDTQSPEIPEWMKFALECPVCLETIMDPPIFICENTKGHSLCSTCYKSIQKQDKACPVCRAQLKKRRNVSMESMVEWLPNKVKCKYEGCSFKRSDVVLVKKHEEKCDNRHVPCASCDDKKIGLKTLADHVTKKHCTSKELGNGKPIEIKFESQKRIPMQSLIERGCTKSQLVFVVTGEQENAGLPPETFLLNWCPYDDFITLFWIAYVGPKESASLFHYNIIIGKKRDQSSVLGSIRPCVPCDWSHEFMKEKRRAIMIENGLLTGDMSTFVITIFKP